MCLACLSGDQLYGLPMQDHRGLVSEINEMIRHILLVRPQIDPNMCRWRYYTWKPILCAAKAGDSKVAVQMLLKHPGIDADRRDESGRTPLSCAASIADNSATVRLFLDHAGVDPNSTDCNGWTPLSWTIFGGCVDSVRELLDHTKMSRMECKRAATLRLAKLWLGRKLELGLAERLCAEGDNEQQEKPSHWAVLRFLRLEIDQLSLKQYSAAIVNAALVLNLLEEADKEIQAEKKNVPISALRYFRYQTPIFIRYFGVIIMRLF